ncbi:nucleolin-like [Lytechinus variegatus]|uniref:nucleolin-like n=1 Tax=Lytechinus variegatus TaxID=7654 RepID=UPI001BB29EC5|nr:nucleolin-like [Lytechinus variegatus]
MSGTQSMNQANRQPKSRSRRKAKQIVIPADPDSAEADREDEEDIVKKSTSQRKKAALLKTRNGYQRDKSPRTRRKRTVRDDTDEEEEEEDANSDENDDDDDDADDAQVDDESLGFFLTTISYVVGVTLALLLGYAYYICIYTIHENHLWFSSIMVSLLPFLFSL